MGDSPPAHDVRREVIDRGAEPVAGLPELAQEAALRVPASCVAVAPESTSTAMANPTAAAHDNVSRCVLLRHIAASVK